MFNLICTREGRGAHTANLNLPCFIEAAVVSQESEWWCSSIDFYHCTIGLWNCSDYYVVFSVYHLVSNPLKYALVSYFVKGNLADRIWIFGNLEFLILRNDRSFIQNPPNLGLLRSHNKMWRIKRSDQPGSTEWYNIIVFSN